jgi:rhomboid protease GluP
MTLEHAVNKSKMEREAFGNGKPLFTYIFMAIQIAVFLWLEMHGGSTNNTTLIKYGAKFNPLIYEGEWWRFITPIFLHIGFLHLAMNTLALYYLGIAVERIYGNARFVFIYLFAGAVGFIASFIFSSILSAGASGAIYGCFGALLFFSTIYPKLFFRTMGPNVIIVLAINLVFSFSATGIDNAGHLGGLAGGFLAAGIVHIPKKKKLVQQAALLLFSIALIGGALIYGFNTADAYFTRSYNELQKGMVSEAKMHLQKAVKLNPNFDEAYYNLAVVSIKENNLKQAKNYAEKAETIKPNQKEYSDLVNEINQHLQSSGEGK